MKHLRILWALIAYLIFNSATDSFFGGLTAAVVAWVAWTIIAKRLAGRTRGRSIPAPQANAPSRLVVAEQGANRPASPPRATGGDAERTSVPSSTFSREKFEAVIRVPIHPDALDKPMVETDLPADAIPHAHGNAQTSANMMHALASALEKDSVLRLWPYSILMGCFAGSEPKVKADFAAAIGGRLFVFSLYDLDLGKTTVTVDKTSLHRAYVGRHKDLLTGYTSPVYPGLINPVEIRGTTAQNLDDRVFVSVMVGRGRTRVENFAGQVPSDSGKNPTMRNVIFGDPDFVIESVIKAAKSGLKRRTHDEQASLTATLVRERENNRDRIDGTSRGVALDVAYAERLADLERRGHIRTFKISDSPSHTAMLLATTIDRTLQTLGPGGVDYGTEVLSGRTFNIECEINDENRPRVSVSVDGRPLAHSEDSYDSHLRIIDWETRDAWAADMAVLMLSDGKGQDRGRLAVSNVGRLVRSTDSLGALAAIAIAAGSAARFRDRESYS